MADRGDVLQLRSRVGFGAGEEGERAVVIQASALNAVLPTPLVVPLDVVADPYLDVELLVPVSALEAGASEDHVAIPTHVRVLPGDRFAPGRVGKLRARTLAQLDDKLRLVLDL